MSRKTWLLAGLVVVAVLVLSSCAAGPNPAADGGKDPAGFWLGLWQGFITPVTFLVSLFTDDVNIYEVHNNGNWYNFGFVFGLSIVFGSGSRARASARRPARSSR